MKTTLHIIRCSTNLIVTIVYFCINLALILAGGMILFIAVCAIFSKPWLFVLQFLLIGSVLATVAKFQILPWTLHSIGKSLPYIEPSMQILCLMLNGREYVDVTRLKKVLLKGG